MGLPPDAEEEAVVEWIREQQAELARLDRARRTYALNGPVDVTREGVTVAVPLTVQDVRATLSADDAAEFDQEIQAAGASAAAAVTRKWALQALPGNDALDRVELLLLAERRASILDEAAT
ncbi:hypothetical protein [Streptomyces olivaceiscleroticus]|uniref:Uncharacterized protein n=1 Tax=Streptomyces olivaceiscleroticus TaxID=68245 RepID=A0ABN0ZLT4_9ACTN